MRRATVFALTFLWIVPIFDAQGTKKPNAPEVFREESKTWIKHTKEGDVFVTENASFDFVNLLRDDGQSYTHIRVLHKEHNERSESKDDISGTVTVTTWTLPSANNRARRITFRAAGNRGIPIADLGMFQISNFPCCSAPFENIYFSLLSGKRLYTTNGTPEKGVFGQDSGLVRIDGGYDGSRYSQTRYIGFGTVGHKASQGPIVQYGTDQAVKQRISLLGREYGDNFDVPKVLLTQDGKKLENYLQLDRQFNFILVLQFDDGPEVRIPVVDDVMQAGKATLPPGYSLRSEADQ
jgi:hypothetical protein